MRAGGREGVVVWVMADNGDTLVRFAGEAVPRWYPAHEVST